MQKKNIIKIVSWSTVALIIPLFGQLFVNGWNWGVGDFVFAWVFFNLLGLSYTFVTSKLANRTHRYIAGAVVVAIFTFIWIILATG
jgi:hypothetical protein